MARKTTKKVSLAAAPRAALEPRVLDLEKTVGEMVGELRIIKLFGAGTFLVALANFLAALKWPA